MPDFGRFADGSTVTVRPAGSGSTRFFAFAVPRGHTLTSVTYYAADGSPIVSRRP